MRAIVWFREDLRVNDNPALWHAAQKSKGNVVAIFLLDIAMWQKHEMAACRVEFLLRGLQALSLELAILNIPLLVRQVDKNVPADILKLVTELKCEALFFNQQYEVNELARDAAVTALLEKNDIAVNSFHDQTILLPGSVTTGGGGYFKVFTAYKRAWYQKFSKTNDAPLPAPKKQAALEIKSSSVPTALAGFKSTVDPEIWPSGEKVAHKRLQKFIKDHIKNYAKERDFPALCGTSQLSPYLAMGMISARECFHAALLANHNELDSGNQGAATWMVELIWRDFYKNILIAVPRISKHHAYKRATEKLAWRNDKKQLQAWQEGNTGFPLIDAAMRQLNTIGWMHNRLRMVVAMYLAKNLFLDWRLGERYFIQHLIDGDLSSNNGGWQWSASTGTDAVPYFRVFNPVTQSERFDPNGTFIRKYCPELAALDDKSIHDPHSRAPLLAAAANYPMPTVDLKKSRAEAIERFKKLGA
jgi:deoxyribodipyrimidine photo-lyase